jgi:hypothetical protein
MRTRHARLYKSDNDYWRHTPWLLRFWRKDKPATRYFPTFEKAVSYMIRFGVGGAW